MSRATSPLEYVQVLNAKSHHKPYCLYDGDGLHLRISPSGTKSWLFNYYHPVTKKRTNISFGLFPYISLELARKKRLEARALLENKIDPKNHREKEYQKRCLAYINSLKQ